jgi:hypothetical protein
MASMGEMRTQLCETIKHNAAEMLKGTQPLPSVISSTFETKKTCKRKGYCRPMFAHDSPKVRHVIYL